MQFLKKPDRNQWSDIIQRPVFSLEELEPVVKPVLDSIRLNGDTAVRQYTLKFDGVDLDNHQVNMAEVEAAADALSESLKAAIRQAADNITTFHQAQHESFPKIETMPGVTCWRKSIPIDRVGIYIPGGTAPLFSTVLMLAIPARLAGCREIVLCSPPDKEGKLHPAILFAAHLSGVTHIFRIGGAQAIGAMAYGTATVPKTDKIFGPGNQYVTVAKRIVASQGTAIDMPAGPSEVAILADETAQPTFLAADLLSQAEHGADSQVILVSTSEKIIRETMDEVSQQLDQLPRKAFAEKALKNSRAVLVDTLEIGMELLNQYAAEHLILSVREPEKTATLVRNAGSVFLGHLTPESVGDYASGTNHTLPTNGWARVYSGVSIDTFVKKVTFQQLSPRGIQNIGKIVEEMAEAEGLEAHRKAVSVRLEWLKTQ